MPNDLTPNRSPPSMTANTPPALNLTGVVACHWQDVPPRSIHPGFTPACCGPARTAARPCCSKSRPVPSIPSSTSTRPAPRRSSSSLAPSATATPAIRPAASSTTRPAVRTSRSPSRAACSSCSSRKAKRGAYAKAAATARKLASPASRFSIISPARSSGSGRLSRSARLLSFNQKISRLVLSRATICS